MAKRIVLSTFGSLGDLHPFLALAEGLRARGCQPVIATHELYRARIEARGLDFSPLRPDYDPAQARTNLISMDPWRGTEFILREGLFPHLRDTYEDLGRAVEGADLLVSHTIVFASPLIAETRRIPWVSVVLAPLAFLSATDPSHAAPAPWANKIWSFGPPVNRALIGLLRGRTRQWCAPIFHFRRQIGLGDGPHPLFEGMHSPELPLALFSRVFAAPQPDWPRATLQTGFCFMDDAKQMPGDLRRFLDDGPAPVVFTLGSAAVLTAGDFFLESARAVGRLGCRAVFVAGKETRIPPGKNVFVAEYAPYSQTFPRASVVVHQGGIGTTAQGLRAGRPALIVPFAHDQPDNAARIARAGIGRVIPSRNYTASRAAKELDRLLSDSSFAANARDAADRLSAEDGVDAACRALLERI